MPEITKEMQNAIDALNGGTDWERYLHLRGCLRQFLAENGVECVLGADDGWIVKQVIEIANQNRIRLHEMAFEGKHLNMSISGLPANVFCTALVNFLKDNGGTNFVTTTVEMRDTGRKYSVTVQDCNGVDSPAEKINRLQNQQDLLRRWANVMILQSKSRQILTDDAEIQHLADLDVFFRTIESIRSPAGYVELEKQVIELERIHIYGGR